MACLLDEVNALYRRYGEYDRECDRASYHQRILYIAWRGGERICPRCEECVYGDELEEVDGEFYCGICAADQIEYECNACGEMFESDLMDAEWTVCLDCSLRAERREHRREMKRAKKKAAAKPNKTITKVKPAAEPAAAEPRRSSRLRGETVAEPPWIGLRGAAARAVEPAWLDL